MCTCCTQQQPNLVSLSSLHLYGMRCVPSPLGNNSPHLTLVLLLKAAKFTPPRKEFPICLHTAHFWPFGLCAQQLAFNPSSHTRARVTAEYWLLKWIAFTRTWSVVELATLFDILLLAKKKKKDAQQNGLVHHLSLISYLHSHLSHTNEIMKYMNICCSACLSSTIWIFPHTNLLTYCCALINKIFLTEWSGCSYLAAPQWDHGRSLLQSRKI